MRIVAVVTVGVFVSVMASGVAVENLCDTWRVSSLGRPRLHLPPLDQWRLARDEQRADCELPNVLEGVARALRSGASLHTALAAAAPTEPQLLADDWRALVAISDDSGVATAAERWRTRRLRSRSVALACSALAICADIGGPQARAVDAVALTLRHRLALVAEQRALTAQARASAVVVATAPLGFVAIAAALEPSYLPFLIGTRAGLACLVAGALLNAAGFSWMRHITRDVA